MVYLCKIIGYFLDMKLSNKSWGYPNDHPFLVGFPLINRPFLGDPPFMETPIWVCLSSMLKFAGPTNISPVG